MIREDGERCGASRKTRRNGLRGFDKVGKR